MAEKKYKISINLDSKQLRRDLSQAKTAIDKFTKGSQQEIKKTDIAWGAFIGGFAGTALTSALSTASRAFVDFSKESIRVAVEAQETIQKFNVVFRDVSEEANFAAESLAEGFGLATTEAKRLLGNTADLLSGFGFTGQEALELSLKTNKLAADLASFSNIQGGAARASEILTKALLGERDSLVSLGIKVLEEDVKKQVALNRTKGLTFATEMQAKAYATLELATKQSTNAIGDYSRSSDSASNVNRRFDNTLQSIQESLGNKLIPVLRDAKLAIVNYLSSMDEADLDLWVEKWLLFLNPFASTEARQRNLEMQVTRDRIKEITQEIQKLQTEGKNDSLLDKILFGDTTPQEDVKKLITELNTLEKKLKDIGGVSPLGPVFGPSDEELKGGKKTKPKTDDTISLTLEKENRITEAIVSARYERQEILDEIDVEYDEIKLTKDEERALERIDMAVAFKEVEISNLKDKKEQELMLEKLYEEQKLAQAKVYQKAREKQKAQQKQKELEQEASFWSNAISLSNSGNKELAMIGKAAALTNIAIKTPDAIANSFAFGTRTGGPVLGAILGGIAAAAMAAQAARVSGIAGFETGGVIASGTDTGDRTLIRANRKERVLTAEQNRAFEQIAFNGATGTETNAILQSINMNLKNPTPIYIDGEKLTDEINARQNRRLK